MTVLTALDASKLVDPVLDLVGGVQGSRSVGFGAEDFADTSGLRLLISSLNERIQRREIDRTSSIAASLESPCPLIEASLRQSILCTQTLADLNKIDQWKCCFSR